MARLRALKNIVFRVAGSTKMRAYLPGWIAAVVLFLQLPIPLYWFVMHPQVSYWRRNPKAATLPACCYPGFPSRCSL